MADPQFLEVIDQASEEFADHEKVTVARVTRWFDQFMPDDQSLAAGILRRIEYYSSSRIRGMTSELANMCFHDLNNIDQAHIYFVPVGAHASGSSTIARALRDLRRRNRAKWNIATMADIESIPPNEIEAIVFVDDFSGTGNTLVEWWENVEPLVLPKAAPVVIATLVLNYSARKQIDRFADYILCVDELDENSNALSPNSNLFSPGDKEKIVIYCELTGASREYRRGYGDCGLLIAFKHGCPNNSLPILWFSSDNWVPLFQRSSL